MADFNKIFIKSLILENFLQNTKKFLMFLPYASSTRKTINVFA